MKVLNHFSEYKSNQNSILTIGTFDGVHLGHQKILQNIVSQSISENLTSIVLTFYPTPAQYFGLKVVKNNLNTIDEKTNLIKNLGLNSLIIQPFDDYIANLEAEKFVKEILVEKLKIKKIIIGYDHRFGKNRSAGFEELVNFGIKYKFEVFKIESFSLENTIISSSKIRNLIEIGKIENANTLLGSQYNLEGRVIHGKKIGNSIGFPTINLKILDQNKLIPKIGVYFVKVKKENSFYFGMMNIGFNPTFNHGILSLEIHLFDFKKDVYNQNITVYFINRIRDEIKFESKTALMNQLEADKGTCLTLIQKYNNESNI